MTKTRVPVRSDKRSRLDLDLFVLALLEREIKTPYSFQTSVGLSPGATIPALNRLKRAGFLRRGKSGARGRAEYEITLSGNQHLRSAWQQVLNDPIPADVDAILRIASLAALCGADRKMVVAYLQRAATAKAAGSRRRSRKGIPAESSLRAPGSLELYPWMQALHANSRVRAEAELLRQIARTLSSRR